MTSSTEFTQHTITSQLSNQRERHVIKRLYQAVFCWWMMITSYSMFRWLTLQEKKNAKKRQYKAKVSPNFYGNGWFNITNKTKNTSLFSAPIFWQNLLKQMSKQDCRSHNNYNPLFWWTRQTTLVITIYKNRHSKRLAIAYVRRLFSMWSTYSFLDQEDSAHYITEAAKNIISLRFLVESLP